MYIWWCLWTFPWFRWGLPRRLRCIKSLIIHSSQCTSRLKNATLFRFVVAFMHWSRVTSAMPKCNEVPRMNGDHCHSAPRYFSELVRPGLHPNPLAHHNFGNKETPLILHEQLRPKEQNKCVHSARAKEMSVYRVIHVVYEQIECVDWQKLLSIYMI